MLAPLARPGRSDVAFGRRRRRRGGNVDGRKLCRIRRSGGRAVSLAQALTDGPQEPRRMGLQRRALPASARVASAWPGASAQKRARSAPQRRTTPQHIDATPLQPPESRGLLPPKRYDVRRAREGRFRHPVSLKSIGGYDDVNYSSYSRSVRTSDAARHNNNRRGSRCGARALHGGARLRQSLRGNTRSSAIRPAATCNAGGGARNSASPPLFMSTTIINANCQSG